MPYNITSFINSFTDDIAKPNRFEVIITVPPSIGVDTNYGRQLALRCESADLPSRSLSLVDQKFGSNPIERHAINSYYGASTLNFIVSGDMSERIFFDNWLEYINPTDTFNLNYRDTYVTPITINQYDNQNNLVYAIELVDAFPTSVNQLDLDWSQDGHLKLAINIEYRYWRPVVPTPMVNPQETGLQKLQTEVKNIAVLQPL